MKNRYLLSIAFLSGLAGGWFAKSWLESYQLTFDNVTNTITGSNQSTSANAGSISVDSRHAAQSELPPSSRTDTDSHPLPETKKSAEDINGISIVGTFNKLLQDQRYYDAMSLFQEQKQQSEQTSTQLKISLIDELKLLIVTRNNSDFSALVESYLSIYYDDIDVLLLLAEFNQTNGSYLEVVNVFLLAKTYAYSEIDQEKVASRFNGFVMQIDSSYTRQRNWWSLINFYAHINTSGLMTSTYQYRQALAHLQSGDQAFAIEQFNQLLDDSQVGDLAANALSSLTSDAVSPTIVRNSSWEGADSIALQKLGNQYAVSVDNNRQGSVKLLIDTGASMTAVSTESFNALNASGDAVEQDRRVFRTANGLVQATVFSFPELRLGPHRLENTQIAVIDFESGRGIDGLLGMNILGQFRFHLDQDSSKLLLIKK